MLACGLDLYFIYKKEKGLWGWGKGIIKVYFVVMEL